MKSLAFKLSGALVLTLLAKSIAVPQDVPAAVINSPFGTVFHLLSSTRKSDKVREKSCLASSMVAAEKYDELLNVVEMVEGNDQVSEFAGLASALISKGRTTEAFELVTLLLKQAGKNSYELDMLLRPLIRLGRDVEAVEALERLDESDRIDSAFVLADIYLEFRREAKALETIESIQHLVEKSKYDEDRANLAFFFAKLGKKGESLRFLTDSMRNLSWTAGKPEYLEGGILDRAVETYRILGKHKEATELLTRQGVIAEIPTKLEIAQQKYESGDIRSAEKLLETHLKQTDPKDSDHIFGLRILVDVYLARGKIDKAEKLAKSFVSSIDSQQKALLNVVDHLIKKRDRTKALNLLRFAVEQTRKIEPNADEDGRLWTSPKMDHARYQAEKVRRYAQLQDDKSALALISLLKKPYLKAKTLAEYVSTSRPRLSPQELSPHLEQAVRSLREKKVDIFDERRFDVYGAVALGFAELGMHERANEVFAEAISTLDSEMIERGTDCGVLFGLCSIGVEFEKANIEPSNKVRSALKTIVSNWEKDLY